MPDSPKYSKTQKVRHRWVIGVPERPTTAKEFEYGIQFAKKHIQEIAPDRVHYDDAYLVEAGDGGEIIVYFDEN